MRQPVNGFAERKRLEEAGGASHDVPPPRQDELIAYGPLLSDDGTAWLGTAALLWVPDRPRVDLDMRIPPRSQDGSCRVRRSAVMNGAGAGKPPG